MKILLWLVGGLFGLGLLYGGAQYVASERVEVVELHTMDEAGKAHTTRLWVVDHDGSAFLRAGHPGSSWYRRMQTGQSVRLTRAGVTRNYSYEARPELNATVNRLMREKYTWGDAVIEVLIGGRSDSIAVRLVPHRESATDALRQGAI